MQTPEQIITGFGPVLRHHDLAGDIGCQITASKFIKGGESMMQVPLNFALLECFDCDCHFTQYTATPAVRCVKANAGDYELSFRFAAFDLDFAQHSLQPTRQDFCDLVRFMAIIDEECNVLYETRSGARAIYLIDEITGPDEFEAHYKALLHRLENVFRNASHDYRPDTNAKDWTRLYRAPLVERDGIKEYQRLVRLYHTSPLNLRTFKPKMKPKRKPISGNMPYTRCDGYLTKLMSGMVEKVNRNSNTFAAICHVYRRYDAKGREQWIEHIRNVAISKGLDDNEFDRIHTSAQRAETDRKEQ